ncbi:hypothetical protein [Methylobacterium sp. A54F]
MSWFILLTLAHALAVQGPSAPVYVNRGAIITARSPEPPDPLRPSARTLLRLSGPAVLFIAETPAEVVRAPCIDR